MSARRPEKEVFGKDFGRGRALCWAGSDYVVLVIRKVEVWDPDTPARQ